LKRAVSIPIAVLVLLLFSLPFTSLAGSYTNVTFSEAKSMIDSNPSLVVLDVRTQTEYDSGHIGNAKLIPVTELEGRLDELHTSDEILVYCRSGVRSATASQILADNGFLYVHNMLGGIIAWIDAGYAVYVKYSSIQEAINNASEGDTIFVSSGTYYENVVVNKSVSLIGENKATTIIDGNGTGNVVLVEGDDSVTVTEVTVRNGNNGFYILGFNHSIIGNVVTNNTYHGIELVGINNSVTENTVTDNWYGILLGGSSCNIISRNTILSSQGGINLDENCECNEISENTLMDNVMGIGIVGSNNSVFGNTIKENWSGLEISGTNNTIYHNSFVNNTIQVYSGMLNNAWDNGCEGNYWSNYNGTDLDGDGIGDTELPWEGVDYYPLMNPYWNPADVDHDLDVDLYDAVRLLVAYGFKEGDEHYNPHCDIAEPYGVINLFDAVLLLVNYGEKYP